MKIVTFCAHQPYIYLFKGMNVDLDLIQIKEQSRFLQNWNDAVRPLPKNWNLISWEEAQARLKRGYYQLALAHNISDYIDFLPYPLARVLVIHTTLSGRLTEERTHVDPEDYKKQFFQLIKKSGGAMVFVSEHKRKDWNLAGKVIPLAVDPEDYHGYHGEKASILRVSNQLIERGEILDYETHCYLTKDLALSLIGHNPKSPEARIADGWEDLKECYRSHRVYLHTAKTDLEDGYNTAMLEAMGTGMPIVCTAHPTSPVIDGVNGFISTDKVYLREKLIQLLNDQELAQKLGQQSRETALKLFHINGFQKSWEAVFKKALQSAKRASRRR